MHTQTRKPRAKRNPNLIGLTKHLERAMRRLPGESWMMLNKDGSWQIEYSRNEHGIALGEINTYASGHTVAEFLAWMAQLPENPDFLYCADCEGRGWFEGVEGHCAACHGHGVIVADASAGVTVAEWHALGSVRQGADVYSYVLAGLLRSLQSKAPQLVDIGSAQAYQGDGTDQTPYFGAIATGAGMDELTRLDVPTGRVCRHCGYEQALFLDEQEGDYHGWYLDDVCTSCSHLDDESEQLALPTGEVGP